MAGIETVRSSAMLGGASGGDTIVASSEEAYDSPLAKRDGKGLSKEPLHEEDKGEIAQIQNLALSPTTQESGS